MDLQEIRFKFEVEMADEDCLADIFKKTEYWLNIRLDENLKPYIYNENENIYEFMDASHLSANQIETISNSFFDFTFDNIVNVSLYKFLVLKIDDNKLTVLAIIHSLIFDYTSIKKFTELFNNPKNNIYENNILNHYKYVNNYLKSAEFKTDSIYWKNHFLNAGNYVKYYNIKSDDYKNIRIPIDNEFISGFLDDYNVCEFEFITAVFALYLTRVDRTKGTILKTIIPKDTKHSALFDMYTLLKIPYIQDCSFIEYLNEIETIYNDSVEYTKVDIDNYIGDVLSYYEVYDFTKLENVNIFNGKGSAFTLNIYGDYLDLSYNAELFSDVYMKHMADNISHLINNIISSPNQFVNETDILCDIEKDLLSDFCKGNSADVDKNKTFAAAFRENAIKYPDFIAVDDGINQVTYAEMEKSSNSVAYDLKYNYGVDFGDCVGLMVPRNYHFPELACALNKIGAVFTPIDPIYPSKRIEHMLNISEARYIITTKEYADNFSFDVDVIYIEDLNLDYDVSVECLGDGDDLLAIFFTSGTTGLPKAVMVSNKEVKGCAVAFKNIFNSKPRDVVGSFVSFSFIASIRLLLSLIFGECCRIFNEMEQKDSLLLVKALKEQEICDLILPPSIGVPIFENEDIKLKYLILAGAKLNELTNTESDTRLVNFYGTTELILAIANIYDLNNIVGDSVPIGKPVANTWVYILDDNGMQMPIGVPGEICISSDFLSPGYYNQPDLTNSVFVDNPYCSCDENRRMYHTGDIGFYNFNGEIEILGREDDQLSVRGFRIESNEVLNIMKSFDGINDVYLDVDNDMLTVYYTASDDLDISAVKDSLNSELPYYMIPSLFVKLDKIPLNANGKIDKHALKIVNAESDVNVGDETLNVVLDAFRNVLSNDSVLLDDNLIELGGTSLSAMNLQRILKDELGVSLSSREIIDLATPTNIANHIKYNLSAYSPLDVNYTFEDKCPLSESQLNVYLDEKVKDMGTAYNNPFKIQFKKKYSFSDVENAIGKLWKSYPVLSARVMEDEGGVSFNFDAEPSIVCGLSSDIDSFVEVFDLNKSLVRFLFVEDESLLCMDFHHLIIDGTSLNIILDSLLDNLNGDIVDFVDDGFLRQISMEENMGSDYMENASDFFEEMLVDLDETYDLLDCVKLDDNDNREYFDTFDVDGVLLDSFLKESGVTYNQFFCGVFAYTLSRFTGSSKVSFNLVEDGRGHVDLSESVGMFVRTLPLLVDCRNQSIDSFIQYCGSLVNRVMFYDLYPFRLLARDYDLNSNILFQYSHELFSNALKNDFYRLDELEHDAVGDLSFFIFNADNDKFGIRILYSDKYSNDFVNRFARSYNLILKEMLSSYNLSDINYVSDSDVLLLDNINETEHDLLYSDILDAFNGNLSKYPDNMLVSYNNRVYSYGEGAFIADRIAKKLVGLGVEIGDCVSFLIPRSELYMFSILGILSMGGVYVPLDDNLPDERIKFMLNDTGSDVVIVSDETYDHAKDLVNEDVILFNISDIINGEIGSLSSLPVVYGDLACILYTSGTTGIPKGVKITRKSIVNLAAVYQDKYEINVKDVYGLFSTIGFDAALLAVVVVLYSGACLSIVPDDVRLNTNLLNEYFISQNVSHTLITSQVSKLFMENVDDISLDVLLVGGEKLGEFKNSGDYLLVDAFGPTEFTVFISSIKNSDKVDSSSVGSLNYNTKAYVLDNESRRVPIGAVGELYLAGYQIAEGYLNRPEETDKAFLDNPFDEDEYSVLYRTGDIVRILPDGSLGLVGRRDNQVKIRGNRVELGEVESTIRSMDDIEDVTIQTMKNNGNNELVAYVVSSSNLTNYELSDRVQDYVSERKPDYMVPSFVMKLDEIPLNVNGKVDKRALPDVNRDSLHVEYAAPRDENEKEIVEAFEKAFNLDKISIYDDFIRLGGDSLIAVKLLNYIESDNVTMADILTFRTPEAIAKNMSEFSFDLDIYSLDDGCPLNSAQINVIADVNIHNKVNAYHIPGYIPISGKYGLEKITDSLDALLDMHPILSTHLSERYEENDNDVSNMDLIKDLTKTTGKSGMKKIMNIIRQYGIRDINGLYKILKTTIKLFKGDYPYLVKGNKPPISVKSKIDKDIIIDFFSESFDLYNYLSKFMIVESEESYFLFYMIHHIIFDATSAGVFKQDFMTLLDEGSIDFDDTFLKSSAFTHQIKNTEKFDEADKFYQPMLSDLDDVGILLEDNPLAEGYNILSYDLEFDKVAFKSFLHDAGISKNVLFTSVFSYALSHFVNGNKVIFTIIENGRDRFNENFIGMTSNVMPVVIDCKDQYINSYLRDVADTVYGVLRHSYYPILLLCQKYDFEVNILFQYIPNWIADDFTEGNVEIDGINFEEIYNHILNQFSDFLTEFFVQIYENDDDYTLFITHSNRFSDKMIEDFANMYTTILSNIIHIDTTSSNLSDTLK